MVTSLGFAARREPAPQLPSPSAERSALVLSSLISQKSAPVRHAALDSTAMTVSGSELAALLERRGFDFFAGVPCSLIEDLLATLQGHPRLPYIPPPREYVAVGLAAGAGFAGRRPAVLMQNSGLGTSLNALASLAL